MVGGNVVYADQPFEGMASGAVLIASSVIASASEAIQKAARQDWIASSLTLLAMTAAC